MLDVTQARNSGKRQNSTFAELIGAALCGGFPQRSMKWFCDLQPEPPSLLSAIGRVGAWLST